MKNLLLVVLIFTLSCEEEIPPVDNLTECQKALEHIRKCVGYRPYFGNCNDSRAERILSTPCENIEELWR